MPAVNPSAERAPPGPEGLKGRAPQDLIKTDAASVAEMPNRRIKQERAVPICHRCGGRGAFRHAGGLLALPPKDQLLLIAAGCVLTACRFLTAAMHQETTHMAIAFLVIASVTAIVYVASMLIEDLHDSSGE
jgi:hypothetical protein